MIGQTGVPSPSPPFSDQEEEGVVLLPHDDIVLDSCPAASEKISLPPIRPMPKVKAIDLERLLKLEPNFTICFGRKLENTARNPRK